MLRIKELTVGYTSQEENYTALDGINLELAPGETCAIIGPSGCGKSTLLKVLAGIITDFAGQVEMNGQPLRATEQRIGFIPQNYGLLPWKTVYENICLGTKIKKQARSGQVIQEVIGQLGLGGLEKRYPGELSGGQQQRVSLARSFLLQPDLLLMDEPFSALDAMTREEIQQVFLHVWKTHAVSTFLVTHHVEEAVYLGKKIVILSGCPGRISQVLDNPLFGQEAVREQAEFFRMCLALRKLIKEDWSL